MYSKSASTPPYPASSTFRTRFSISAAVRAEEPKISAVSSAEKVPFSVREVRVSIGIAP